MGNSNEGGFTMKVLVIGSEGNIGTPLVKHLRHKGHDIREVDIVQGWRPGYTVGDINHPLDLLPAFDWGPDVVILLSAMVSRVTCEQASSLALSTNLSGINNVLQLCKRSNSKVVFFSTSEIYGPECNPMDESISDPKPNNRYGLSKLLGEKLVEYEVQQYKLRAVTIRPFMMYDENEDFGDHRSAMIRFAYNLAHGLPIEVHRGSARSWLHVSDAVRAIEQSMYLDTYSVINIGHPEVTPMDVLARMICTKLGADFNLIKIVDVPERITAIKRPLLERQKKLLGIVPNVSLEEGATLVCNGVIERIKQK